LSIPLLDQIQCHFEDCPRKEYLKNYELLEKETEKRNQELRLERKACLLAKTTLLSFERIKPIYKKN
jgi:hypothetical protein